jgi:hypothetical protein
MQRVVVLTCLMIVAVCWATWTLRAASSNHILGRPAAAAVATTIGAIRRNSGAFVGKTVAITGRMTSRCPSAGCWFYVDDGTGDLRVDAKEGGFSVLGVPLGTRLTVSGTVVCEPGEDPQLFASGARS